MTRRPRSTPAFATLAALTATLQSTPVRAQSIFQWTGAIDNLWNAPGNWINLDPDGPAGFPTIADTAVFNIDASVNGGTTRQISNAANATLTIAADSNDPTLITKTILNAGVITFPSDNTDDAPGFLDKRIQLPASTGVTASGGGTISLNGSETGIQGQPNLSSFFVNEDHTITGHGTFQDLNLDNKSEIIIPSGSTITLRRTVLDNNADLDNESPTVIPQFGSVFIERGASLAIDEHSKITGDNFTADDPLAGQAPPNITGVGTPGGILEDVELENGPTIGSEPASSLRVRGSLTTSRRTTFIADATDDAPDRIDQRLLIEENSTATLKGNFSSPITLNGSETGIEGEDRDTSVLVLETISIEGHGTINNLTINNQGRISPEDGTIELRNTTLINNQGRISPDDGTIELHNATLINDSGTIELDSDSALRLVQSRILNQGGVISPAFPQNRPLITIEEGSSIEGGSLAGYLVTPNAPVLTGSIVADIVLRPPSQPIGSNTLVLTSDVEIQGNISLTTDNTDDLPAILDQRIFIPAGQNPRLFNAGTLTFSGTESGIQGEGPNQSTLTVDPGYTINASGTIDSITINNSSSVSFGDARNTRILQAPGATAGVQRLDRNSSITGGKVTSSSLFLEAVPGAELTDVTFSGPPTATLTISGEQGGNSTLTLRGAITNNRSITLGRDTTDDDPAVIDQRILIPNNTTISGSGSLRIDGVEAGIQGASNNSTTLINGPGHTLSGDGVIADLTLINEGIIKVRGFVNPSLPQFYATLNFDHAELHFTPESALDLSVNRQLALSDSIQSNAAVTVDGSIQLEYFSPGLDFPRVCDRITIVSADSITGEFANIETNVDPIAFENIVLRQIITDNTVEIFAARNTDLDADTVVGLSDLLIVLSNFGNPAPLGQAQGDVEGDGVTDLLDLLLVLSQFGDSCPI